MKEKKYFHFLALGVFSSYYLISLIFFGEVIYSIRDNLEAGPVFDHTIGKIYKGSLDSLEIFLSGEFKWFYLDKIFFPINLFHFIFDTQAFYLFEDILKKAFAYWSFYLFSKKIINNRFYSSIGAILYSTLVNLILTPVGYAIPLIPYLLYLLTSKKFLNKKHYFIIFLLGLNTSLIHSYLALLMLIPVAYFLNDGNFKKDIFIKYFFIISFSTFLAAIPIFIAVSQGDLNRELYSKPEYLIFFFQSIEGALRGFNLKNYISLYHIPKEILFLMLTFLAFVTKNRKSIIIVLSILLIFLIKTIVGSSLIDIFFINFLSILKGFNFTRIEKIIPVLIAILLVINLSKIESKGLKNILFVLTIITSISLQLSVPLSEYIKLFLNNNLESKNFLHIKEKLNDKKYFGIIEIFLDKKNYKNTNLILRFESNKSFNKYYRFSDYSKIKELVKDSKTISIGLNPMIAAMNNIKIVDGYHNLYTISYKARFYKIIENELKKDKQIEDYFNKWGNRLFVFYKDKESLSVNFDAAKELGADFVISAFPITQKKLNLTCGPCFQSKTLYLYKIL